MNASYGRVCIRCVHIGYVIHADLYENQSPVIQAVDITNSRFGKGNGCWPRGGGGQGDPMMKDKWERAIQARQECSKFDCTE